MNILPKKSWHVRNKDNVARVRRDEAAAEVERRKRDARALRAEQEVRTELLRKRARVGGRSPSPPAPPVLFPPPEEAPNREHEAEKRREQERRERALGLLTYLGQSAAEAQTNPPWYLRPPRRGQGARGGSPEAQGGRKALLDPLQDMREKRRPRPPSPEAPPPGSKAPPPGSKAPPPGSKAPPPPRPAKSAPQRGGGLEELRRQRLAREAAEAARSRELLRGLRNSPGGAQNSPGGAQNSPGGPQKSPGGAQNLPGGAQNPQNPPGRARNAPGTPQDRQRPYNSQFHPNLARKFT